MNFIYPNCRKGEGWLQYDGKGKKEGRVEDKTL